MGGFGSRRPKNCADVEATTMVTTMTIITAFTVAIENRPISRPTNVAASVAAACTTERPNITPISSHENLKSGLQATAASSLPSTHAAVNNPPSASVPGSIITAGSMIAPTDTRNSGMSSADPKNSMRSMNSPSFGTNRFRARPAKNAPTIDSMPNTSASTPDDSMATSTNR